MIREDTFWRRVAVVLVLLTTLAVIANLNQPGRVPSQIMLLLFGSLVALATPLQILSLHPSGSNRLRRVDFVKGST